jgi:phosphoglycerate dehydrogenase-like enzyme
MALRVHLLQSPDDELLVKLGEHLNPGIDLTCSEELPDPPIFDVLVCGVPDKASIEASPSLRYLIIPWSGLPRKTRALMRGYPQVAVHNIHHNAAPVAEMAITLMLIAAKDVLAIDRRFRRHNWGESYTSDTISLMAGKRALIVGYGAIGREIASRCLAFRMKVSAIRRSEAGTQENIACGADNGVCYQPGIPGVDVFVTNASRLPDLLPGADVLFLSVPLTEETDGMIGARELSLLPTGSILVNVSRGRVVDEAALYEHLKVGRIRAGLDVWYNYPKTAVSRASTQPSVYPFHELSNVVMTPHLAGHSDRTESLRARELANTLNLASESKPLPNRVDLDKGY